MILDTPSGKYELPDGYDKEYKQMSDIELLETLLEQNKKFLDPVLVQICVNKGLLKKGEMVEDMEMKLDYLKIQEYSKLKAEIKRLNNAFVLDYRTGKWIKLCELQQQLKEKDAEIEKLENKCFNFSERLAEEQTEVELAILGRNKLIFQVCEKIREEMQYGLSMEDEKGDKWLLESKILLILDQVEKGEIDGEDNS